MDRIFDLAPKNGRKSFYGKAKVIEKQNGDEILRSYNTDILLKNKNGLFLICNLSDLTPTTCTHVKSYCGLCKKDVVKLERK